MKWTPWGQFFKKLCGKSIVPTTQQTKPLLANQSLTYMFINIPYIPDWENIKAQKQLLTNKNIIKENKKCLSHDYKVNDNIIIYKDGIFRQLSSPFLGTYKIIEVYTNGTVRIKRDIVTERINIRRLTPYTADE